MSEEPVVFTADGVRVATRHLAGTGSATLAFAHATGFCQRVWDPVLEGIAEMGGSYPTITWDQRGHGASDPPPGEIDWWDLGRDALAVLSDVDGMVVGIGHSSGATALIMAEILAPGRFTSIVAIEPIIFPPPYGPGDNHPLAEAARRRRASFPSRQAALANFEAKPVFAEWDRRALEGYMTCGLIETDDGGVRLACNPAVEAAFYAAAGLHAAWDRLRGVEARVTVVAGARSISHPAAFVERQAAELQNASAEVIDGAGHFVPMEQPQTTARIITHVVASATESTSAS